MARIECHGHARRTESYWLYPKNDEDKKLYKYQILYTATCPKCNRFIMEWQPVFLDWTRGKQKRIGLELQSDWIRRTDPVNGDLSNVDTSRWESVKKGVHWVSASRKDFPYNKIKVRV
jgi:hypothetical protein